MAKKMGNSAIYTKSEADWQAEDDMRTLARAEEIKDNPKRLRAAQAKAKSMLEDMQDVVALGTDKDDKKK